MSRFDDAFDRVRKPGSHYWAFWCPEKIDTRDHLTVEVRLNVPDGDETCVSEIYGWVIAHRKTGMLFLRREQSMDQSAIEDLFRDVLEIAVDNGWQFHSWCHYPDLPEWAAE